MLDVALNTPSLRIPINSIETSSLQMIDVAAGVAKSGTRFLICKRPHDKHHGGLWEFPGGKHEEGEGHQATLAREFEEELGLSIVSVGSVLYSASEPGSPFLISFYPVEVQGEVVLHEHEDYKWISVETMEELTLAPVDALFVQNVIKEKVR